MEKMMSKNISKPMILQNQPFSPSKFKTNVGKGFCGLIIPTETVWTTEEEKEEEEPTSPKVSCIGQIKHKNWEKKNKKLTEAGPKTKAVSSYWGFFSNSQEKISGAPRPQSKGPKRVSRAPDLSHKRGFASGHDKPTGFDWWTHVAPVVERHQNINFSTEDSEGENEVRIPFSAPIIIGDLTGCGINDMDLKPRNEINLWKRRTMAQLRPIQVAPLR